MIIHRFRIYLTQTAALWVIACQAQAGDDTLPIRLNTIGYLPAREKKASIAAACTNFSVVRLKNGESVFKGSVSGSITNSDTREELWIADFSSVREAGEYQLDVPGVGRSAPFSISAELYRGPFYTVVRAMYLWRCGTAVSGQHNGQTFAHAICHTNDAWLDLATGQHVRTNSTKGWHDAGDYNKYVVNAGITVGSLFRAWEDFGPQIKNIPLNLPEAGGALPEFLAEIKWEIDWLLTTQFPDGSVSHKVSTKDFGGFILPEQETESRFLAPWGSVATADFVAMTAQAARYFKPYAPTYAATCLAAARKSYAFLQTHPENHRADLSSFRTGEYPSRDHDDRLWAAAELWETTGDPEVLKDFETRARTWNPRIDSIWDWSNVSNLGMFTYALSTRTERDETLVQSIRANILSVADQIVETRNRHGYARPLGTVYDWGGNGTVARQTMNLCVAYRLSKQAAYLDTALDALNYLFGRNFNGRSYVTGLGFHPPMHPHDRRSRGDQLTDPWPGYLVSGPNPSATDWQDSEPDFRHNEIAINWNGALIYALAAFAGATSQ